MVKTPKSRLKVYIGLPQKMHSDSNFETPPPQIETPSQTIGCVTRWSLEFLQPCITFVFGFKRSPRTLLNIPAYIHMLVVCLKTL